MEAALAAWGATSNLFQKIIVAAMDSPGIVIKRAVGTRGPFQRTRQITNCLNRLRYRACRPARETAIAIWQARR
jgi:hypothetical protein